MDKKSFIKLACLLGLILLSWSEQGHAAPFKVNPGKNISIASVSDSDTVQISVAENRSYCAEIVSYTSSGDSAYFDTAISDNQASLTTSVVSRGAAYPRVYNLTSSLTLNDARICFTTSSASALSSLATVTVPINTLSGLATGATLLRVDETTLTGGFNTSVSDFNFLEITNSTTGYASIDDGVINGTVRIRNVINDQTILTQSFSVNPGDRVDINVHDAVGSGVFGLVTITHDGVPGALKANLSQYRLVTAVPFDFEPVVQERLLTPAGTP